MVYLIEDDLSVRRGFEMFLKTTDLEFKSFQSADEFLPLFKPASGDIIVLDLNLPGLGGCDLLQIIFKNKIHVPVIVVSAFEDPATVKLCKELGVKAYLRKPVDGEALLDMIKYNLAG